MDLVTEVKGTSTTTHVFSFAFVGNFCFEKNHHFWTFHTILQ